MRWGLRGLWLIELGFVRGFSPPSFSISILRPEPQQTLHRLALFILTYLSGVSNLSFKGCFITSRKLLENGSYV